MIVMEIRPRGKRSAIGGFFKIGNSTRYTDDEEYRGAGLSAGEYRPRDKYRRDEAADTQSITKNVE